MMTAHNVLTFRLGAQIYGLPVDAIVQVLPMVTITPVPEIGSPVAGVINVRGQVVPVVDLRRHLGLAGASFGLYTPIVLAHIEQQRVGLVVDEVLEVLDLPAGHLAAPAAVLPEGLGRAPVLHAIARVEDRLALLLDARHLFGPEQSAAIARAAGWLQEQGAAAGQEVGP